MLHHAEGWEVADGLLTKAFLFEDQHLLEAKVNPLTLGVEATSGVSVMNGIIIGGANNGEALFTNGNSRNRP